MDVYLDLKKSAFRKVQDLPNVEVTEQEKKIAKKENFNVMVLKVREKLSLSEKMSVVQ